MGPYASEGREIVPALSDFLNSIGGLKSTVGRFWQRLKAILISCFDYTFAKPERFCLKRFQISLYASWHSKPVLGLNISKTWNQQ